MDKLKETQELRQKAALKIRAISDDIKKADGEWTDEQRADWDRLTDEIGQHETAIEQLRADADRLSYEQRLEFGNQQDPNEPIGDRHGEVITRADYNDALKGFILPPSQSTEKQRAAAQKVGIGSQRGEQGPIIGHLSNDAPRSIADVHRIYDEREDERKRAQSIGTDSAGGYLGPDEAMREIDIALLKIANIRQYANVIRTATGNDLPIPTVNDTTNTGTSPVTENAAQTETDAVFANVVLNAYMNGSDMVRVSYQLMQDSATNMAVLLGRLLGERIARAEQAKFTVGTGTAQHQGYVTGAANSSITLAANNAITYAELVDIQHAVEESYRMNATWSFKDEWLKYIRKIVTTDGLPIWQPAISGGPPATILDSPYFTNNQMPTGASSKCIIYGDFSKFMIRDVTGVEIVQLNERYAEFGQVAFLGWKRSDSAVIDAGTNPIQYATAAA